MELSMEPVIDFASLSISEIDFSDKTSLELSEDGCKKEIRYLSSRFTYSSGNERNRVLVTILNKSAHNPDFLRFTVETKEVFDLFKSKCKRIYNDEYISFVEKCFNFFNEPSSLKAMEIVSKHINPVSMHPVHVRNAQKSFENMCKLLASYNENKESITKNIRLYLKEILIDMSLQFSVTEY